MEANPALDEPKSAPKAALDQGLVFEWAGTRFAVAQADRLVLRVAVCEDRDDRAIPFSDQLPRSDEVGAGREPHAIAMPHVQAPRALHRLDRRHADHLVDQGIESISLNPDTVVLDHVSVTKGTITGAVYVKYSFDREKRAALEAWSDHLSRLLESPT